MKKWVYPISYGIVCGINEIIPVPGLINIDCNYLIRSLDYILLDDIIYYWAIKKVIELNTTI